MQTQKSVLFGAAAPMGWPHALWPALLVAASVAFSLGFACAVPYAALAAAAALTLTRRDALLLAGAVWLANELVGFAILDYPLTASAFVWGLVLGIVAILATLVAQSIVKRCDGSGAVAVSLAAFVGAFIMYEGGLFAVSATMLGGTDNYVPAIVTRILEINAAAFAGLLVLNRLAIAGGVAAKPAILLSTTQRQA